MSNLISPKGQQITALELIRKWNLNRQSPFKLGGYAGSGKTSLIPHIRALFPNQRSTVVTYTNKASAVLREKGIEDASTIYRLMYTLVDEINMVWRRNQRLAYDLVLVDEASMVGKKIRIDLEAFNIPILYCGDPFQLGPVGDDEDSIMERPDYTLTDVQRHGDKILEVVTAIREGKRYPDVDQYLLKDDYIASFDAVICLSNAKRWTLNQRIRKVHGRMGDAVRGDRVMSAKTDYDNGIFAGETGTLLEWNGRRRAEVMFDGWAHPVIFHNAHFLGPEENPYNRDLRGRQCLDFGYVHTCHKAQGSQFDKVLVWVERRADRRWIYTAATRAVKDLVIAGL